MSEQDLYKLPNKDDGERNRLLLLSLFALIAALFAALAAAASTLAASLAYPPALGAPILAPSPSRLVRAAALSPLALGLLVAVVLRGCLKSHGVANLRIINRIIAIRIMAALVSMRTS